MHSCDRDIMQQAIAYSETGHLCLATLHANNASQTLDRIINFFPESARQQLLIDMSLNLKAVVSLRLLRGTDGKRIPAVELMLSTPYVADLIEKGEIHKLRDAMKQGKEQGMQSFDDALYQLHVSGRIDYRQAMILTWPPQDRQVSMAALLDRGVSLLDTVLRTGYADQPRFARSIKRSIGKLAAVRHAVTPPRVHHGGFLPCRGEVSCVCWL
ncbi:MAG TPA: ATPase, T2SS/T4P/T4SS family [Rhodanobacter sp.]|nr:ATPase, T2SS/T4P/T4SS family [Rhodanobacter sp.]